MMIWRCVCSRVGSHREAATLSGLSEYLATIQGFKQVTLPRIWLDNNRWKWMDNNLSNSFPSPARDPAFAPRTWVACYGLSNQFTDRALKASGWMLQKMVMYTLCCALCRMEIVLARNGMSLRPPISIPSNYLRPISTPSNYQKSQQRQQGLAGKSVRYAQAQDLWTCGFVAARRSTRSIHSFHFIHWSHEFHFMSFDSFIHSFIHSFVHFLDGENRQATTNSFIHAFIRSFHVV